MIKIKISKISRAAVLLAALSIVFVGTVSSFADEYVEHSAYVRVKGGDYTLGDLDGDGYIEDSHGKGKLKMTHATPTVRPHDEDETSDSRTSVGENTERPETSGGTTSANTDGTLTSERPITTVPRTTTGTPNTTVAPSTTGANTIDNDNVDGGFNWLGLIIGIIVAAVILLIVILLIPKKGRDSRS